MIIEFIVAIYLCVIVTALLAPTATPARSPMQYSVDDFTKRNDLV